MKSKAMIKNQQGRSEAQAGCVTNHRVTFSFRRGGRKCLNVLHLVPEVASLMGSALVGRDKRVVDIKLAGVRLNEWQRQGAPSKP